MLFVAGECIKIENKVFVYCFWGNHEMVWAVSGCIKIEFCGSKKEEPKKDKAWPSVVAAVLFAVLSLELVFDGPVFSPLIPELGKAIGRWLFPSGRPPDRRRPPSPTQENPKTPRRRGRTVLAEVRKVAVQSGNEWLHVRTVRHPDLVNRAT